MYSSGKKNCWWRMWKFDLLLLAASCLLLTPIPCRSVVLVYNQTAGQLPTRFEDVPAMDGFGPRVPEEGFAGRLQLAKPSIYACSALDPPAKAPSSRLPTTAVVTTQNSSSDEASSTSTTATAAAGDEKHGAIRRGWGKRTGRATHNAVPIATSRHQVFGAVSSAGGGEEELPSAVLISRSIKDDTAGCTFEAKVLHAQAAGYSMVVVYDYRQENLFKMSRATDTGPQHPAVDIPLVLVNHASGAALAAFIKGTSDPRGPEIYLDNSDPFDMLVTVNLTMLMMVTGFLLALLTCGSMMVVTLHRYLRRYESLVAGTNRPMSLPEVLQLSEVRVEAGSKLEGESCPVCLEVYRLGDKLRSLPCEHAFHAGCITPWLTQRQRTCPMCKDPITLRPAPSSTTPSAAAAVVATAAAAAAGEDHVEGGSGGAGGGARGGDDVVAGDRLPLLSNSRGAPSEGGSIQATSPV
ncbi:unnamed protein product [Pylaiella littoralis]